MFLHVPTVLHGSILPKTPLGAKGLSVSQSVRFQYVELASQLKSSIIDYWPNIGSEEILVSEAIVPGQIYWYISIRENLVSGICIGLIPVWLFVYGVFNVSWFIGFLQDAEIY